MKVVFEEFDFVDWIDHAYDATKQTKTVERQDAYDDIKLVSLICQKYIIALIIPILPSVSTFQTRVVVAEAFFFANFLFPSACHVTVGGFTHFP